MSYYLFLDDIRDPSIVTWVNIPKENYVVVRNYKEFVECIETDGVPAFVSFDHDLGDGHYLAMLDEANGKPYDPAAYGEEKTGLDCAKWLVTYCLDNDAALPQYAVHSLNPGGARSIDGYMLDAKFHLSGVL